MTNAILRNQTKTLFVLLISIFCFSGYAQSNSFSQTIRGEIKEVVVWKPISGATIIITTEKTKDVFTGVSDEKGHYKIELIPVGVRFGMQVSCEGYITKYFQNLTLETGKELVLDIDMEEALTVLKDVVVSANKPKEGNAQNSMALEAGSRSFSVEQTERYAGGLGDPSRLVQSFAGVASSGGGTRNDIVVRGNGPTGLLWKLDGVTIPNPNHFAATGSSGGVVSMLNTNLLTTSDFYSGTWPTEFINATSAVFDLRMRNGNNNKYEFTGQFSFNGLEFGAEGPFSKKSEASYMLTARYMDFNIFSSDVYNNPKYKDLTAKVNIPTEKAGTFSILVIGGDSDILTKQEMFVYKINSNSEMKNAMLNHKIKLGSSATLKSYVSYSSTLVTNNLNYVETGNTFGKENSEEDKVSVGTTLNLKINAKNYFEIGANVNRSAIDYFDSFFVKEVNGEPYNDYYTRTNTKKNNILLTQAFFQWRYRIVPTLNLLSGVSSQYLAINNTWSVEPRVGLKWNATAKHSFNIGYGLHSQAQPFLVYYTQTLNQQNGEYSFTNKDLKMTKSNQFGVSWQYQPTQNFRLKVEPYYQYLYDVPVRSSLAPYQDFETFSMVNYGGAFFQPRVDYLSNEGNAKNYGVEITSERFLANGWYALATGSFFSSTYQIANKEWYSSTYNQNYIANVLGGYEKNIFRRVSAYVSTKATWAGPRRVQEVDEEASITQGFTVYSWENGYSQKTNPYFRLDLNFGVKQNYKKYSDEWGMQFQDLTNHPNEYMRAYDPVNQKVVILYQANFPIIGFYRIKF